MRILNIYLSFLIYTLISHVQKFVFCDDQSLVEPTEEPKQNVPDEVEQNNNDNSSAENENNDEDKKGIEKEDEENNDSSLRGNKHETNGNEEQKQYDNEGKKELEKAKVPDTLVDALVLVLLLSILATILTVLVLLMAVGLNMIFNKRKAKQGGLLSTQATCA